MLNKLIRFVDMFTTTLGVASLGMLICVAFTQVIARYVFSHALPWPEEFCRFMFITLTYVGIAQTMRNNKHLCVDLLLTYSSPQVAQALKVFSMFCTTTFMLLLGYLAYQMIWDVKDLNYMASSMPIPIYITWIPIPLCMWLTAFYGMLNIVSLLKNNASESVGTS